MTFLRWRAVSRLQPMDGPLRSPRRLVALELLAEAQALALVIRADALAVELVRPLGQPLIDEPADHLAVLDQERHLMRADLEHGAAAGAPGLAQTEAGIEEAGVMHPEFADQAVIGQHLGGMVRRYDDGFLRCQDIEIIGIEDDAGAAAPIDRLPEIERLVMADPVEVDQAGMAAGAIAHETGCGITLDIDREGNTALDVFLAGCGVVQAHRLMQRAKRGIVVAGLAPAQAQLL